MNRIWRQRRLALLLALSLTACGEDLSSGNSGSSDVPARSSVAESSPVTPAKSNLEPASPQFSGIPPAEEPIAQAPTETPELVRDYAPEAALPATGQVTIRGDIRNLDDSRLIADCPADSAPYAFAESSNYLIQICSAEYDPWLPKYYIGRAKVGGDELRITNAQPETASQLVFRNGDYTYALYRDSARPASTNAYLEVYTPDGQAYAEALLYFYERIDRPVP